MRTALILLAAISCLDATAALPRATEWCNGGHESSLRLVGSESALAHVEQALRNPSMNRKMFERLWQPEGMESEGLSPELPILRLWFNEVQDPWQIRNEISSDPFLATLGISTILFQPWYPSDPWGFAPVVMTEYFSATQGHYRYALSDIERNRYDEGLEGPGWRRTGQEIIAAQRGYEHASPVRMFRFHAGVYPGSQFFTESPAACGLLRNFDWGLSYAGAPISSPWWCLGPGFIPVERFYNGLWKENDSSHRLVSHGDLYSEMIDKGWIPEGRAFCALAPDNPKIVWPN